MQIKLNSMLEVEFISKEDLLVYSLMDQMKINDVKGALLSLQQSDGHKFKSICMKAMRILKFRL